MWRRKKEEEPKKKEAKISEREKAEREIEPYEEEKGGVILKDGKTEGLSAIIKVSEEVQVEQDHDLNTKSIGFNGKLNISNPSKVDRLWDIDLTLKSIEGTNLESNIIKIKELGITDEDNVDTKTFQITGKAKNLLLIKEYINTLPDADDILNIKDIEVDLVKSKEKGIGAESKPFEEKTETEKEKIKVEEKDYDSWTIEELKDYCEKNNIEVPPDAGKSEIIDLIKATKRFNEGNDITDAGVDIEKSSLESYGISINKLNIVYFAIALRSLFEKPLGQVKIVKNVPEDFGNLKIIDSSSGIAEIENKKIIWTIDKLEPESTILLKFTGEIQVDSKEGIKTGVIEVSYKAESSFTGGLEIEKFNAYTNNKHYIDMVEKDEKPGTWDCKLVFENPSEFMIELFDARVYTPEDSNINYVKIEEGKAPTLPAGAKWHSSSWVYEHEDYPIFRKDLGFRVTSELQAEVNGTIALDEVELVLASITGKISYEVPGIPITKVKKEEALAEKIVAEEVSPLEEVQVKEKGEILEITIPSYKETEILAKLTLTNNGSAPLNEVKFTQKGFTEAFHPPNPKDPEKPDKIKLLWDNKETELDPESIKIDDNSVQIILKNLKDTPIGLFNPDSTIEVLYPIHAESPPKDAEFDTDVVYNANTYPLGQELEYIPVPEEIPVIKVIHIRRKYRLEKEVIPIGDLGNYHIVLRYENLGENVLKDFILIDKVPDNFEYSEFTMEPEITDEVGKETLKWSIENLEVEKRLEISYKIKGKGEYHPSDAQVAF